MEINIKAICKSRGLSSYELAALVGSCHSTQSRVEAGTKHRSMTTAFYWLLQHLSEQSIPTLLDRWLYDKPRSEEQVRLLRQIARRHKLGVNFRTWDGAMRKTHPEFFF